MTSDSETGRCDAEAAEIKITRRMISAGIEAVSGFSPAEDPLSVILSVAYRAMLVAGPASPSSRDIIPPH